MSSWPISYSMNFNVICLRNRYLWNTHWIYIYIYFPVNYYKITFVFKLEIHINICSAGFLHITFWGAFQYMFWIQHACTGNNIGLLRSVYTCDLNRFISSYGVFLSNKQEYFCHNCHSCFNHTNSCTRWQILW